MEAANLDVWENNLTTGKIIRKATKIFAELGYPEAEAAASMDALFSMVHPEDLERLKQALDAHLDGKTHRYECEFRVRAKAGHWVWYANSGKIIEGFGDEDHRHLVGVTYNIDDRRRQEEELRRLNLELSVQREQLEQLNARLHGLAMIDALTELPNRRLLIDRVNQALHVAKRTGQLGALLFLDSDNFKVVNDTYGHHVGDLLLTELAKRLSQAVRESDTVARISGDEFVVMLENLGSEPVEARAKVQVIAEKIIAQLNAPYELMGYLLKSTVSMGAALMDQSHHCFDDVCPNADLAMYEAKRAGRNTFRMFSPQFKR